jgi:hypothetical protein
MTSATAIEAELCNERIRYSRLIATIGLAEGAARLR